MTLEKARDTLIKALNHPERRQILTILKHQPEGTRYTAILGETELTTAKLNYQLNELHLLIEKTPDGQYTLSELGKRAAAILDSIDKNLEGDLELQPIIENTSREQLKKTIDRIFAGVMITYSIAPLLLTHFYLAHPEANIPLPLLTMTYLIIGAFIIGLNYARKAFPHMLFSLYEFIKQLLKGIKRQY
jgi:DNA-binding transcriptional ArsR family regulator